MDYSLRNFGDILLLMEQYENGTMDDTLDSLFAAPLTNSFKTSHIDEIDNNCNYDYGQRMDCIQGDTLSQTEDKPFLETLYDADFRQLHGKHSHSSIDDEIMSLGSVGAESFKTARNFLVSEVKPEPVTDHIPLTPTSSANYQEIREHSNRTSSSSEYPMKQKNDVGLIYQYQNDDSSKYFKLGRLNLLKRGFGDAQKNSTDVNQTIDEEFKLYSLYILPSTRRRKQKRTVTDREESSRQIKKNTYLKKVAWKPLSIFTVYTNIKAQFLERTDYFERIPPSSCFGRLNMRVKRAWSRTSFKEKLKPDTQSDFQLELQR